jgi:hypothetical protein
VSVDEFIDGLSAEAREAVRPLLQQAYDRGFREALASAGQPAVAQAPIEPPASPAPAPAPTAAPVAWAGPVEEDADDPPGVEDEEGEDDAGEPPVQRPILPRATVGTLRRRIVRMFDLERFEIEVVICRSGDPDRRQLQNRVRLKAYRREEG